MSRAALDMEITEIWRVPRGQGRNEENFDRGENYSLTVAEM